MTKSIMPPPSFARMLNPHAKAFKPRNSSSLIEDLPIPIIIQIVELLSLADLLCLAYTCRRLRTVLSRFSIPDRLKKYNMTLLTRYHDFRAETPTMQLRRAEMVRQNRTKMRFGITDEARWQYRTAPILRADDRKLVLCNGNELWVSIDGAPWDTTRLGKPGMGDITGIVLIDARDEILISSVNGSITRYRVDIGRKALALDSVQTRPAENNEKYAVESIDLHENQALVLAAYRDKVLIIGHASTMLPGRPWCTKYLSSTSVVSGCRGTKALVVHDYAESTIRLLRTYTSAHMSTSVFDVMTQANGTIISAWSDGTTRLHDLRSQNTDAEISWSDPFDDNASYCLAGHDQTLYTGSARNGTLRVYDIRFAKGQISNSSVFLGGLDERGPLYSIIAEHERVVGAFQTSVRAMEYWPSGNNTGIQGQTGAGCYLPHTATRKLCYTRLPSRSWPG